MNPGIINSGWENEDSYTNTICLLPDSQICDANRLLLAYLLKQSIGIHLAINVLHRDLGGLSNIVF